MDGHKYDMGIELTAVTIYTEYDKQP